MNTKHILSGLVIAMGMQSFVLRRHSFNVRQRSATRFRIVRSEVGHDSEGSETLAAWSTGASGSGMTSIRSSYIGRYVAFRTVEQF